MPRTIAARVTWSQALAWRMQRHGLDPLGDLPVEGVVRRLCGVQSQVASSAELAVRIRRRRSDAGEAGLALGDGRIIKTWAMRGTLHLLSPEDGGAFLSVIAAGRSWERPSWQRYFGATPDVMEHFRVVAREALAQGPLTREELIAAVVKDPRLEHIGQALRSGWGTLLKPLAWQGDLCFGPSQGTRVTFTLPEVASDRWAGLPEPEEAAPQAVAAYLGAYGPATIESFGDWLAGGWFGKRRLRAVVDAMGDGLVDVEVDGERLHLLAEHVDELAATTPSSAVRLLGGFDQYVLGPGTGDAHIIAPGRRTAVSKQSGWIAPVVLSGGVVAGTWEVKDGRLDVGWFKESGAPPRKAIEAEVERLGVLMGRALTLSMGTV